MARGREFSVIRKFYFEYRNTADLDMAERISWGYFDLNSGMKQKKVVGNLSVLFMNHLNIKGRLDTGLFHLVKKILFLGKVKDF